MLYISKVDYYLKILTDEEVKDFAAISFNEYFKSIKKEQNLRKIAKSLYNFPVRPDVLEKYVQSNSSDNCVHHYNVEISNLFDPELQLIDTKPVNSNELKELLSELQKFKVQTMLVLHYKKRNDGKIFHSSANLTANDSDIDAAFKFMYQSIITKIINNACKYLIVLDVIIKSTVLRFLSVSIMRLNSIF